MTLIEPKLCDDTFLNDVQNARIEYSKRDDVFCLWWLGQSGFLVQWRGKHLVFDPYLSDSLTEKYAQTDKPHVRISKIVIAPEKLDFIDIVTNSHNHTDHLDAPTLQPILTNANTRFVIPEANRAFIAERLKQDDSTFLGLNDGETLQVGNFEFHGIAAAHNELEQDEQGRHKFMGYVVKFGPFSIYHSGDTLLYDDLMEKLLPHNIHLALLPINGNKPERRVAGNLDGREAAQLADRIGAKIVIPCHYDMFTFNTASPDEFVAECEQVKQTYRVLEQGERFIYEKN